MSAEQRRMTLGEVVGNLRQDRDNRTDAVLVPGKHITLEAGFSDEADSVHMHFETPEIPELNGRNLGISRWAHQQIADRSKVPWTYYQRMMENANDLLVHSMHTWWGQAADLRMVRTVSGGEDPRVRAWLSDRFLALDNLDFLDVALTELDKAGAEILAANVDEQRLYLKALLPRHGNINPRDASDVGRQGVIIRNSEVGDGRVMVSPFLFRLVCKNGLVAEDQYAKVHLGSRLDLGILSEEAKAADAKSVWLQVRDWIRYCMDENNFAALVLKFQEIAGVKAEAPARKVIASVSRQFGLDKSESMRVLEKYLRADDDTQFGVLNAVTNAAQQSDFRRQVELEEVGGRILGMTATTFERLIYRPVSEKEIEAAFGL